VVLLLIFDFFLAMYDWMGVSQAYLNQEERSSRRGIRRE